MSEQAANLCTTDAAESLREIVAERDREIERLKEGQSILILARDEQKRLANEYRDLWSRAALKAQPSGVVLADDIRAACQNAVEVFSEETNAAQCREVAEYMREVLLARLNSSPVSAGEPVYQFQCREIGEGGFEPCDYSRYLYCQKSPEHDTRVVQVGLQAPSHGEQVRDGWQRVPVEPTPEMLAAGDKYIGTPATYKAMLSACPSPAITKDFSQFLSAVMDAAGLIRHGRQSKELSEYLGMKCMEYRGAALSAPSHGGGVAHTDCRSEDGITVGLIDSIITSCRVLSSRDLTCEAVVEALRDLRSDSDVSLIKPSHGEQVRDEWASGFKLHEIHKALDCGLPLPSYWAETCDGEPYVHTKLWRGLPGCASFHSSRFWPLYGVAMLTAAPSAGSQGERVRDNRAKFKREERYMVVKLSKLADDLGGDELSREEQIYRLAHFGKALVECVVVESDWPEYEPTWAAIKARVTGSASNKQLPGGWAAKPTDDGEGFIISSPRINGVASHFSVFPDSKDYASRALWKMLAATPSAGSQGGDV